MSFANYSNISDSLANATRQDKTPFLDDIENYKRTYEKGILETVGTGVSGKAAVDAIKLLRTKYKGIAKSKFGFDDDDLADIQESFESGDMSQTLSTLTSKLTGKIGSKLTDAGKKALQGMKDKLEGLKSAQEDAQQGLQDARSLAQRTIQGTQQTQQVAKPRPARDQIDDTSDMDQAVEGEDLIKPLNRQIARYNNLDGRAQARVDQNAKDSGDLQKRTDPDEDISDLPEGHPDIDVIKNNFEVRNNAIKAEEQNPETTFKDENFKMNPADDENYQNIIAPTEPANRVKNPDEFDNSPEVEDVTTSAVDDDAVTEAATNLASKAVKAGEVASKVTDVSEGIEGSLEGLTAASTSLDWSPVGWLATAALGIGSLFAGLELKSHKRKFETPPNVTKSYANQADV